MSKRQSAFRERARWPRAALLGSVLALAPHVLTADPVTVRHTEGLVHGFLSLSTLDGSQLADGEFTQVALGDTVTIRLVFQFKDGSLHDETTVFTQRQRFRLVSDHVVQTGRAFPRPLDMTIDASSGQVTVRYADAHGQHQVDSEHLDLPSDLANGLVATLIKNLAPEAAPTTLSLVAATPKPRLVKVAITPAEEDPFSTGGLTLKAAHYVLKVEIGGVAGLLAPLVGRQPPDSQVWILEGAAPAFVKSEQPLYVGGPLWRIELVSPVWPHAPPGK